MHVLLIAIGVWLSLIVAVTAQFNGCAAGFCPSFISGPTPSPPTVSSVSPNTGTTAGGTSVAIGGTNYGTGGTSVTSIAFGLAAASFSCSSSIACTATSPPGTAGTVDVTVTTSAGVSAISGADQFTYSGGFTPGCMASGTWLARTSGLSTTERDAYDHMICVDMIPNGIGCSAWSGSTGNDDLIYIFATNTTTTAKLNLCGSGNTLTPAGNFANGGASPPFGFTADVGYQGDGSTGYLDTGAASPLTNYTQNAAFAHAYVLNNRTGGSASYCAVGGGGGTGYMFIAPNNNGNGFQQDINGGGSVGPLGGQPSSQGAWIGTRTASNLQSAYKNGSSTAIGTDATASAVSTGGNFLISGCTFGSPASNYSADQIAAVGFGGPKTGAQAAAWNNAINRYMAALGINIYSSVTGCAAATTYLSFMTGLIGGQINDITTLICGLDSLGYLARMDGFYIYANANAANARINAVNPSVLAITTHGTCTFTADQGFTGDGSTCYQDPGFVPSTYSGNYMQDAASVGACILNNRTTPASDIAWGAASNGPTGYTYLAPLWSTGNSLSALNQSVGGTFTTSSSSQGDWSYGRSSSVGYSLFLNGATVSNVVSVSNALPSVPMLSMAFNNLGTIAYWTSDTQAIYWFGGFFNGTEFANIHTLIHNYTTARGATGC